MRVIITKSGSGHVGMNVRVVRHYPNGNVVVQTPDGFRTYRIGTTCELVEE